MAKVSLLLQLIHERDEIDAAIRVMQRYSGATLDTRIQRHARKALRQARNGPTAEPEKPKRINRPRGVGAGAEHTEPLPVPTALRDSIGSLEFPEAVVLAVKSAGVPVPTSDLRTLLDSAGVTWPPKSRTVPPNRYVGIVAGHLVRLKRLKKTAHGWTVGSKR